MRRVLILTALILSLAGLGAGFSVLANGPELSFVPATLELNATEGAEGVEGQFAVTAGEADVANLEFAAGGLQDAGGIEAVAAEAITITPPNLDLLAAGTSQTVTVSIGSLPGAGSYESYISISYTGQLTGTQEGVTLSLTVEPPAAEEPREVITPDVRIDPEGQPLSLLLTSDGQNYEGQIAVTSYLTGVEDLELINFTDLTPVEGQVPAIMGAKHVVTPADAQTLEAGETKLFAISFPKPDYPGTYTGTMEITYDGRPGDKRHEVKLSLVAALPEVSVSPSRALTLNKEGKSGPYKATFSLSATGGEVSRVEFTKQELTDARGGRSIFPDKITVDPQTATLGPGDPPQVFTLSVQASEAGTYEGPLDLSYFGTAAHKAQGVISLNLKLTASPEASLALVSPKQVQLEALVDETRTQTVKIQETSESNDVTGIGIVRVNLVGKENSQRSIPAGAITLAAGAETTLARGETGELPLVFDFGVEGVRAGEFSGNVTVKSDDAPDLDIPVEVALKNGWVGALIVLALGVFVGMSLTWYQGEQRKKDEAEAAIERLEERLKYLEQSSAPHDVQFIEFYGSMAQAKLDHAATYLEANLPDSVTRAEALVKEVQDYFGCWVEHATELYRQWKRAEALRGDVEKYVDRNKLRDCKYLGGILASLIKINDNRADYKTDTDLKNATDEQESRFGVFEDIHGEGEALGKLLDALDSQKELECETVKGYRDRIDDQMEILVKVEDGTKLPAIEAALGQIRADVDRDYQTYPHQCYRECKGKAQGILDQLKTQIGASANKPPHWEAIRDKIQSALSQADDYYDKQVRFQGASQLAHNAWRAAWFYKQVILDVRKKLEGKDTTQDPWKAVLGAVEEIERWLVATSFGEQSIETFHQQLLVTSMTSLYQKLGQAEGAPVESPDPDPLPVKPYRDLDAFARSQRVVAAAALAPRRRAFPAGLAGVPSRLPAASWGARVVEWFAVLLKVIGRILGSFFGDPRIRLLSVEAIASLVTVVALAYWGMQEMWFNQSAFGENGWLDYVPLFLWGFAADATKTAIFTALRGLPGLGKYVPGQ